MLVKFIIYSLRNFVNLLFYKRNFIILFVVYLLNFLIFLTSGFFVIMVVFVVFFKNRLTKYLTKK